MNIFEWKHVFREKDLFHFLQSDEYYKVWNGVGVWERLVENVMIDILDLHQIILEALFDERVNKIPCCVNNRLIIDNIISFNNMGP